MTPEELVEHGPALAGKIDDGGLVKAALAAWLVEKKESDKAMAMWRNAIAAVPDKKQPPTAYWGWDLAQTLKTAGKLDDARKTAAEIDENLIAPPHRNGFKKFRAKLASPQSDPLQKNPPKNGSQTPVPNAR